MVLSVPALGSGARSVTSPDLTVALEGVVVLVLAALSVWLLVASALVAVALRTGAGADLARRLAPAWLAATLSTGALMLGSSAQATPADLDGLPLPDRAPAAAPTTPPPTTEPQTRSAAGTVVVQAGDCLWSLAQQHAGPTATDREIARLTATWHAANRPTIGHDPDVLHPGQVLTVPDEVRVTP